MSIIYQGTHLTRRFPALAVVVSIISFFVSACSGPKNITYFKDVPDTVRQKMITMAAYNMPLIQTDDILQVTIQTLDPAASALLNQQNTAQWPVVGTGSAAGISNASPGVSGYVVDKEGYITLPLIGKVLAKDKTTDSVRNEITSKILVYYKDPVVNVRFANFKITVLGEVTRPSSYVMPNEKVTIMDAIGMAGDLTIYGKRENVLLIRDLNGQKEFVRFNLNDSKLFSSPYLFLHQGDIIYVEPNKSKSASTDMAQVKRISIIASVLSLLIVVATRINF
jgi:polysaccharide export outer membrane protein